MYDHVRTQTRTDSPKTKRPWRLIAGESINCDAKFAQAFSILFKLLIFDYLLLQYWKAIATKLALLHVHRKTHHRNRNCSTDLGQLIAYGWEHVFDGHAGGRRCQYAGGYNGVWRHQPRPTELTDSGSHRRSSSAWWTVNDQRTMVLHAEHESRLQLLNAPVTVRVVEYSGRRPIRRVIIESILLWRI